MHKLQRSRRWTLERLEQRDQPAGMAFLNSAGILVVRGTNGPDSISLDLYESGSNYFMRVAGTFDSVPYSKDFNMADFKFPGVKFYGYDGDDYFDNDDLYSELYGGAGNDTLRGGVNPDHIYGGPGNDLLEGFSDNDRLIGGENDDTLRGSIGNDYLSGGGGSDYIEGGSLLIEIGDDDDEIYGGPGPDVLLGGYGDDTIHGNSGIDLLDGHNGNDKLYGGLDTDYLYAGAGNDSLYGGWGADFLYGGSGHDLLDGNLGDDYLDGDIGNDSLYGGAQHDSLDGGAGDDFLSGGAGNDSLDGGANQDELIGGIGRDTLHGDEGYDTLSGSEGPDVLYGGPDGDELYGGPGDDMMYGGSGNDSLYGWTGRDRLFGETGNDYLSGGGDSDGLFGGFENDTLVGNGGGDRFLRWQGNGIINDLTVYDAEIRFRNGNRWWTHDEIFLAEEAMARMHQRVGSTYVLKDHAVAGGVLEFVNNTLDGGDLGLNVLTDYPDVYFNWSKGVWVAKITFSRTIYIADHTDDNHYAAKLMDTIIHEVGHNWEPSISFERFLDYKNFYENNTDYLGAWGHIKKELNRHMGGAKWKSFLNLSGWLPPGAYAPLHIKATDSNWYYHQNATASFFGNYGKSSPYEDFATSWASTFMAHYQSLSYMGLSTSDLNYRRKLKMGFINNYFG